MYANIRYKKTKADELLEKYGFYLDHMDSTGLYYRTTEDEDDDDYEIVCVYPEDMSIVFGYTEVSLGALTAFISKLKER